MSPYGLLLSIDECSLHFNYTYHTILEWNIWTTDTAIKKAYCTSGAISPSGLYSATRKKWKGNVEGEVEVTKKKGKYKYGAETVINEEALE